MEGEVLGDILTSVQSGVASGERCDDGIRQLRMNSLTRSGKLDCEGSVLIPQEKVSRRYLLDVGDIVFNNTNSFELVGQTAIYEGANEPFSFSNHLTRIRVDPKRCDPSYVAKWLHYQWESRRIRKIVTRFVGQSCIAAAEVSRLAFVPPCETAQSRAVALLDCLDNSLQENVRFKNKITALRNAMMQRLLFRRDGAKHFHFGDLFIEGKEKGRSGLPTFSVTRNQGLVERGSLDRRVESELAPEEHLLVRKDEIAYNMMRMWQGVSGLAPYDGLVSPAYVVLKPKDKIDPLFTSYLFKLPEVIRLFHRYSQGLTDDRLRLYYDPFKDIKVSIPESVDEQRRIAKLLQSFDKKAEVLKARIDQLTRLKTALSQEIFN